ncbi:MAG: hypothetical protein RL173_466 [Fibrobacterota bacterium]
MSNGNSIDEGGESQVPATGTREVHYKQKLTIKKLADKLVEIEADKKWGYEIALLGVESLDYTGICELCDIDDINNDPHLMPSRFMLLKGATDKGLEAKKHLDAFPYPLTAGSKETMSVRSLRRHLILAGFLSEELDDPADTKTDYELDSAIYDAVCAHIDWAALAVDGELKGGTHKVQKGDCLSDIADQYGIREWRLLYQLNKDALGENWDVLKDGLELTLPDKQHNPLVEWFHTNDWAAFLNPDKGYEYTGKYLSLTFLDEKDDTLEFKDEKGTKVKRKCEIYVTGPVASLLHSLELEGGDDLDVVIPDTQSIGLWVEGEAISFNGTQWPPFAEFQESDAGESYGSGVYRNEVELSWDEGEEEEELDTPETASIGDLKSTIPNLANPASEAARQIPSSPRGPF